MLPPLPTSRPAAQRGNPRQPPGRETTARSRRLTAVSHDIETRHHQPCIASCAPFILVELKEPRALAAARAARRCVRRYLPRDGATGFHLYVQVVDPDRGEGGDIQCRILNRRGFHPFASERRAHRVKRPAARRQGRRQHVSILICCYSKPLWPFRSRYSRRASM
jgi:hypothetical protein